MNFRRLPFHFSAIDPVARQRDLDRQFGIKNTAAKNMYLDMENFPDSNVGSGGRNSATNSPRLQHRVPIFTEGLSQPKTSFMFENCNAEGSKKPNVRNVPIKIEGATPNYSARHRRFSGPHDYGVEQGYDYLPMNYSPPIRKRCMQENNTNATKVKPRTCNVPINVEGRVKVNVDPKSFNVQNFKIKKPTLNKTGTIDHNSTPTKKEEIKTSPPKDVFAISLEKIARVLEELNLYRTEVQNFAGTMKDKQYKYLDEMLTRCMINLDDVDTMGNEQVRASRKAAVKEVQSLIDILETKLSPVSDGDKAEDIDLTEHKGIIIEEVTDCQDRVTDVEFQEVADSQVVVTEVEFVETMDSQDKVNDFENFKVSANDEKGQLTIEELLETESSFSNEESEMEVADKVENPSANVIVEENSLDSTRINQGSISKSESEQETYCLVKSKFSNNAERENDKGSNEPNVQSLNNAESILPSNCGNFNQMSPVSVHKTCVNDAVQNGQLTDCESASDFKSKLSPQGVSNS